MSLTVSPLSSVGAEVAGFDINEPITEELRHQLRELWYRHGLLLFRDQHITPETQIAFSRIFGELEMHPLKAATSEQNPELFVLENGGEHDAFFTARYDGKDIVGRLDWHIDLHYTGRPNHGALLRAVVIPDREGQTGFGDLEQAFAALDEDTQALLRRIEIAYAFCMQRRHMRYVDTRGYEPGEKMARTPAQLKFPDFPDAIYPGAYQHPVTGRWILGVVEQFLDRVVRPQQAGLCNDEAIELLERLVSHTRESRFHYFHSWREGDMVLWDNWRMMHCTTGTPPGVHRLINRTTIKGDVALGRSDI